MTPAPDSGTAYVLVTTGSAGDLFPFLRMALSLRQRGHDVRLIGPSLHAPMVEQVGIPFHGTMVDEAVLDDKDLWHPRRGFGVVWRAVRPGMREVPRLIAQQVPAGRPCVIIAHPLALPDAVLVRDTGARACVVAAYLAPSNIPTVYDPLILGPYQVPRWIPHGVRRWLWRMVGAHLIDPVALPEINADRAAAGLAPISSLTEFMRLAPDLSVTLFPSWFGPPQSDWPVPLVCGDFALFDPDPAAGFPEEVQTFLADGDAPLIFTHGTGNRQAGAFFAHAVRASGALGRRAILLTPHREQVPAALPGGVLWQAYLPLQRCLPHAAAIVHHGGIGTTAEALRAGVPQLVVPLAFDQFDNGARVERLGTGAVLPHSRLDARSLTRALSRLLARQGIVAATPPAGAAWETLVAALEACKMPSAK